MCFLIKLILCFNFRLSWLTTDITIVCEVLFQWPSVSNELINTSTKFTIYIYIYIYLLIYYLPTFTVTKKKKKIRQNSEITTSRITAWGKKKKIIGRKKRKGQLRHTSWKKKQIKQSSGSFLTAWWLLFCKKLHETQGSQSKFHGIKYIYLIYIYLLLHTHTHTHTHIYIYIYIYIYYIYIYIYIYTADVSVSVE